VYFSVRSYPRYGELSHRRLDDMDQGEGVEGSERKRDPADFALWKAQKPGEDTAWDAPWGSGRPGWHIECSAMAESLLGVGFEIHGGGADLIFPHHENEMAQTAAAHNGAPLARLWVHNGMVRLEETKMSKSLGNIFLLHRALDAFGRDALIMYFVSSDYRKPVEFDDERLTEAQARVRRIREAARRLAPGPSPAWSAALHGHFFDALADDFKTPEALAAVFDWVAEANRAEPGTGDADLRDMLFVVGLDNLLDVVDAEAPPEVAELADAREQARAARDYAEADRLREAIRAQGWEVRDSPNGPELLPA
jgi:cysteinyl-tRNA synthetase